MNQLSPGGKSLYCMISMELPGWWAHQNECYGDVPAQPGWDISSLYDLDGITWVMSPSEWMLWWWTSSARVGNRDSAVTKYCKTKHCRNTRFLLTNRSGILRQQTRRVWENRRVVRTAYQWEIGDKLWIQRWKNTCVTYFLNSLYRKEQTFRYFFGATYVQFTSEFSSAICVYNTAILWSKDSASGRFTKHTEYVAVLMRYEVDIWIQEINF
jgi:hypothetical protein